MTIYSQLRRWGSVGEGKGRGWERTGTEYQLSSSSHSVRAQATIKALVISAIATLQGYIQVRSGGVRDVCVGGKAGGRTQCSGWAVGLA